MKKRMTHWLILAGFILALLAGTGVVAMAAHPSGPHCLAEPKFAGNIYIGCRGLNPRAHYFFQAKKPCPNGVLEENGGFLLTQRAAGWPIHILSDGTWSGGISGCSGTYRLKAPDGSLIPVGYQTQHSSGAVWSPLVQ